MIIFEELSLSEFDLTTSDRVTIVNKIVATLGSKKNFTACVTSWITDSVVTPAGGKIKYKVR